MVPYRWILRSPLKVLPGAPRWWPGACVAANPCSALGGQCGMGWLGNPPRHQRVPAPGQQPEHPALLCTPLPPPRRLPPPGQATFFSFLLLFWCCSQRETPLCTRSVPRAWLLSGLHVRAKGGRHRETQRPRCWARGPHHASPRAQLSPGGAGLHVACALGTRIHLLGVSEDRAPRGLGTHGRASVRRGPAACHPRAQRASYRGRGLVPEAGDLPVTVHQERPPRACSQCRPPWESILSKKFELKKAQCKSLTWPGIMSIFTVPLAPSTMVGSRLCPCVGVGVSWKSVTSGPGSGTGRGSPYRTVSCLGELGESGCGSGGWAWGRARGHPRRACPRLIPARGEDCGQRALGMQGRAHTQTPG